MIKNPRLATLYRAAAAALALSAPVACRAKEEGPPRYQGVVEYDERKLAFEVSGRIVAINVKEGDPVGAGTVIARLDDNLAQSALAARTSEAEAAGDQLALLRAGARGEDVRALQARVEAAKANETLLARNAERMRTLTQTGAMTQAALDEAEAQLARARADRRASEENVTALASGARKQEILAAMHRFEAAEAAAELERQRLARHKLTARQPGEVLEVHLEVNEMAPAGVPIATVADVLHPYVEVFVPQAEVAPIHAGDAAFARVDGVGEEIAGKVELVRRQTEFTPRYLFSEKERSNLVIRVRVRFDDPGRRLHAGVPAFVRFAKRTP